MYICSIGDKTIETSPRSWRTSAKNFHESLAVVFIKLFITHDIEEAIYLSDRIYVLGGSPGVIKNEVSIDIPRKEREEFMMTQEFLTYKKQLKEMLL